MGRQSWRFHDPRGAYMTDLRELAEHVILETTALSLGFPTENNIALEDVYVETTLEGSNGEGVQPEDAVEQASGVMIVGPAGSGKTTLLRFLANRQARAFLAQKVPRCPVFIAASQLGRWQRDVTDLPALVAGLLMESTGHGELELLVRDSCARGTISLFMDGLDEIAPAERRAVLQAIQSAQGGFPKLQIILSSRPSGGADWPERFAIFYIKGLPEDSVAKLVGLLSGQDPRKARQFLSAVRGHSILSPLTRNPLMLTLLWLAFVSSGQLAASPAFLYADISDYLLSNWSRRKGTDHASQLSIGEVQHLLGLIAAFQFDQHRSSLTRDEVIRLISSEGSPHTSALAAKEVLAILLTTGILRELSEHTISFLHLSFLEFYAAKALAVDPRRWVNVIDRPEGHEVAMFACSIVQDVGPLVEAAVQKRLLLLAAKFISNGRLKNQQLAQNVIEEFRQELGDHFFSLMQESYGQGGPSTDVHGDLLRKWKLVKEPVALPLEKGRRLEDFARDFFRQFFTIVSSNLNTENGEVDIVMENTNASPFWLEFGADMFAECKNWSSHVPVHEILAFGNKVSLCRGRLAFFLAVSGFTPDALQTIRNLAVSANGPLIVPLTGDDIERALETREILVQFLKEKIRQVKYMQKY
jgi:hypothetical protein